MAPPHVWLRIFQRRRRIRPTHGLRVNGGSSSASIVLRLADAFKAWNLQSSSGSNIFSSCDGCQTRFKELVSKNPMAVVYIPIAAAPRSLGLAGHDPDYACFNLESSR